jgi:hypothetical protein
LLLMVRPDAAAAGSTLVYLPSVGTIMGRATV